MADARLLREALMSGECIWVKLSREEKEEHAKARKEANASGAVAQKQRKKRSDAGKPRGPRKSGGKRKRTAEDGEDGSEADRHPHKRTKDCSASQMPPGVKSRAHVNDESSDSEDE
ncbi:hypothetical protein H0H92_012476 [Tricholoma furcatifolium]|nr:hypothetical protein H0H92_012476 [Tricholoma furcatifolium]